MIRKFILEQAAVNLKIAEEASQQNAEYLAVYGPAIKDTSSFQRNELGEKLHHLFAAVLLGVIGEDVENLSR